MKHSAIVTVRPERANKFRIACFNQCVSCMIAERGKPGVYRITADGNGPAWVDIINALVAEFGEPNA